MGSPHRAKGPVTGRRSTRVLVAFACALAGVVGLLFATGTLLVVRTAGASMLPLFRTGDLAVLVARSGYHVGQVVAYRSPLLHVTVLHRIVAEHAGRFTFKGDNNGFLDPLRLPASSIAGGLWFKVPDPGGWLQLLESHERAVVSGLVGVVALGGLLGRRGARSRRRPARDARLWTSSLGAAVAVPLGVAGTAGVLYAIALARPASHEVAVPVPYRQSVAFSYSGSAPSTTVYPTGRVTTGMPVFSKLVQDLDVRAAYRFEGKGARRVRGSIAFGATFVASDGWSQALGTSGPVAFRGATASIDYRLDVTRATLLLQALGAQSGGPVGSATVVLTPHVHLRATVGGVALTRRYAPPLELALTSTGLVPVGATSPGAPPRYAELDATTGGAATSWTAAPSSLRLLGHAAPVTTVRADALRAMLAALLAALAAFLAVLRRLRKGEARQIHARYRRELVETVGPPEQASQSAIDVVSIASLAQIAETAQAPLLHYAGDGTDRYFAFHDGTLYRYRVDGGAGVPMRALRPRGAHLRGARRA